MNSSTRKHIRSREKYVKAIFFAIFSFRYRGDGPVISKPKISPLVAAYDFAREISEPEALDELLADPDEMRMQALVIRERILGPAHPDTSYYIRYRGAIYADAGKFRRCIELWNYALDMQQNMLEPLNPMTQSSLFSFTELFSFMVGEEGRQTTRGRRVPPVQREELLRVFGKAVSTMTSLSIACILLHCLSIVIWKNCPQVMEVKRGKQMLDKMPVCERDLTYLNRVLVITLHLACLLTRETVKEGSDEYITLHKQIYELVRIKAKGKQVSIRNDYRYYIELLHNMFHFHLF